MPDTLVAVYKRVIENEGKTECCCFFSREVWIQVNITETLAWLSKGRLKNVDVANSTSTTPPFQHGLVKLQDFSKGEDVLVTRGGDKARRFSPSHAWPRHGTHRLAGQ